jgi:outer membrane lipoprotein-sorting protein
VRRLILASHGVLLLALASALPAASEASRAAPPAPQSATRAPTPASPAVDDIVAKNIAAKGGAEKLRAVTSVRTTGRVKSGRGLSTITVWTRRPNSMRQEMTTDGQTAVTGYDGTTFWGVNPALGPAAREISGPAADRAREEAEDFDSVLLDYREKGYTVEVVPSGAGAPPHLRVTKKNGKVRDIYLDPTTFLEQRISTEATQGGKTVTITTDFSNYRPVDGMMVPFTMRQSANGQVQAEVTYDRVQFNLPLDDGLFRMPAAPVK